MYELHCGDCLDLMKAIPAHSVDMVLCDLPYGISSCAWDKKIDLAALWEEYQRIGKENAVFALMADQPFTSELVMSNRRMFKYEWTWIKNIAVNFLNAKKQPLRNKEDILIFYAGQPTYSPQFEQETPYSKGIRRASKGQAYGTQREHGRQENNGTRYPKQILYFDVVNSKTVHPTQKPVALMEYFIKTYTNPGENVLDNCMGSGTTGVACMNLERGFIGIERDPDYFEIAKKRIEDAAQCL